MTSIAESLDQIERRARAVAGGNHSRGAIPGWAWRQVIAEQFFGEPIRDSEWAERIIQTPAPPSKKVA